MSWPYHQAFLLDSDGSFSNINPPGACFYAVAVGVSGTRIIGTSRGADNFLRGFLAVK